MNKNIWLINHYAVKNKGRLPSLAKHFVEKGRRVCIILSSFDHFKREYLYDEEIKVVQNVDGVSYVYIHSKPAYTNNGAKRILNMLSFCWVVMRNLKEIVKQVGKPDYVIASSVHPFVWEIGSKIAKKYKGKFIAEVRDIWPLSLVEVAHVSKNNLFVRLLGVVERRAYMRSDVIVTSMPFAYKHICNNFPVRREKVHWLPNGIDVKQYKINLASKESLPTDLDKYLSSHWCCVYTGSFVASESIPMMLEAFSLLKDEDIYFAIIGGGHDEESLKKKKEELELTKVEFFPFVPQTMIAKILAKANCCVAAIQDKPLYRYGLSLNKLNDYLISGNPVVFACNFENVVKDAGQFAITSDSPEVFAETILKIKNLSECEMSVIAQRSRTLIENIYDYKVVADKYLEMLSYLN